MLQALTSDNRLLQLTAFNRDEINQFRSKQFFCPICKKQVIIKAGKEVIPHFAHKRKENCSLFHKGESKEHLLGKRLLYEWLQGQGYDVSLEYYISELQQIPDVLLKFKRRKIAIEFQCAHVSPEEIQARNKSYKKLGILPVWLLHIKYFKLLRNGRIKLNSFLRQVIFQFSNQQNERILFFCPNKKRIVKVESLYFTSQVIARGQVTSHLLTRVTLADLFSNTKGESSHLFKSWLKEKQDLRFGVKTRHVNNNAGFLHWLYEKQLYVQHLSEVIYLPVRYAWKMKIPVWYWQSKLLIDYLSPRTLKCISVQDCLTFLKDDMYEDSYYPQLYASIHPVKEYLSHLEQLHYIKFIDEDTFYVLKAPLHFNHIEEAVKADKLVINRLLNYNKCQRDLNKAKERV